MLSPDLTNRHSKPLSLGWTSPKSKLTLVPKCHCTGPHSTDGNVSGNRCESDCRSRGDEFDLGTVPYFRGIISTVILFPSAESFQKGCCQLQSKVCA